MSWSRLWQLPWPLSADESVLVVLEVAFAASSRAAAGDGAGFEQPHVMFPCHSMAEPMPQK